MRTSSGAVPRESRPRTIAPIHELEPQILKAPRLRSIRDLNPDMDISEAQVTEQELSTLPADEPRTASGKSRVFSHKR